MTSWVNYDYRCEECDHIEIHMQDRDNLSEYEYCTQEGCNGQAFRMYSCNVSTSKTSVSIPDGVSNRFGKLRLQQEAKKQLSLAKQSGDTESVRLARQELNKVKRSKS